MQVGDLYKGLVAVPTQASSDRASGFQRALEQVLIRATGDEALVLGGQVAESFGLAESFVLTYSYRENPAFQEYLARKEAEEAALHEESIHTEPSDSELSDTSLDANQAHLGASTPEASVQTITPEPFLLEVSFAEAALKARMKTLSLPIWGSVRPSILMWIVAADEGERSVVGASDISDYLPDLEEQAALRGVPVYLPVADLTDLSVLDIDALWGLFGDSYLAANKRYQPDATIVMRLAKQVDRIDVVASEDDSVTVENLQAVRWDAHWQIKIQNESYYGSYTDGPASELSSVLLANVAQIVSAKYAVAIGESSASTEILVEGIDSFEDYIAIQRYLESLAPVASVELVQASAERLRFMLFLNDSKDMLYQHISLGGRLQANAFSIEQESIMDVPVDSFKWNSLD